MRSRSWTYYAVASLRIDPVQILWLREATPCHPRSSRTKPTPGLNSSHFGRITGSILAPERCHYLISQVVSHYHIIRELGAGGMGETYLAEDTRLRRQVALKFLPASYQYDPDRREAFLKEARATSALRSPHIAALYDIDEHDGRIFIVMEYIEGELLAVRLAAGALPMGDAVEIAAQVVD